MVVWPLPNDRVRCSVDFSSFEEVRGSARAGGWGTSKGECSGAGKRCGVDFEMEQPVPRRQIFGAMRPKVVRGAGRRSFTFSRVVGTPPQAAGESEEASLALVKLERGSFDRRRSKQNSGEAVGWLSVRGSRSSGKIRFVLACV